MRREEVDDERHEGVGQGPSARDYWRRLQERGRANQRSLSADMARSRRIGVVLAAAVFLPLILVAEAGDFAFDHQTPVLVSLFMVGVVVSAVAARRAIARRRAPQGDGDLHR